MWLSIHFLRKSTTPPTRLSRLHKRNLLSAAVFEEGEKLTPGARFNRILPPRAKELWPRHFRRASGRDGPFIFLIFAHDLNAATAAQPTVVTASGAELGEARCLEKLALHDALAFSDMGSVGSCENPVVCELLFPARCLDGHGLGGCGLTRHSPTAGDEGAKPRDHRPGMAGISDDEQLAGIGLVGLGVRPGCEDVVQCDLLPLLDAEITVPPTTMPSIVEHVQCVVRRGLVTLGRCGFEEIALELWLRVYGEVK